MPTGTKVVLAVLGLLVGVLVVYYGFFMPNPVLTQIDEPELITQTTEANANNGAGPAFVPNGGSPVSNPTDNDDAIRNLDRLSAAMNQNIATTGEPASTTPIAIPRDSLTPPEVILPSNMGTSGSFTAQGESPSTPLSNTLTNQLPTKPDLPQAVVYTDYYVKEGDTLSEIAQSWFGNANKWDTIVRVNRGLDPLRLRIGQRILLPSHEVSPPGTPGFNTPGTTSPNTRTPRLNTQSLFHIVRAGENLSRISGDYYGSTAYWERIFIANRLTLNGDPDLLRVGMKLIIPPTP